MLSTPADMLTLTLLRSGKPAFSLGTHLGRLGGSTGATGATALALGAAFFLRGACFAAGLFFTAGAFFTAACGALVWDCKPTLLHAV